MGTINTCMRHQHTPKILIAVALTQPGAEPGSTFIQSSRDGDASNSAVKASFGFPSIGCGITRAQVQSGPIALCDSSSISVVI